MFRCKQDAAWQRLRALFRRSIVENKSCGKEKATAFIPLVVPTFGLLGKPWFAEFLSARAALGLRMILSLVSKAHDLDFVMVPGSSSVAYETMSAIKSTELTDRLRGILAKGFSEESLKGIPSHSLKATLLAYLSIYGCDLTTSELLGYHVNREHASALNYTRDCLSGPIRDLVQLMSHIHFGSFNPSAPPDMTFPPALQRKHVTRVFLEETGLNMSDAALVMQQDFSFQSSRAMTEADRRLKTLEEYHPCPTVGMMTFLDPNEEFAMNAPQQVIGDSQSVSSSDDSSVDSEVSHSEDDEECEASHALTDAYHNEGRFLEPSANSDSMTMYRHVRTRMVHCGHVQHSDRTGCGRSVSEQYMLFRGDVDVAFPKCKMCFGRVQV